MSENDSSECAKVEKKMHASGTFIKERHFIASLRRLHPYREKEGVAGKDVFMLKSIPVT